MKEFSKYNVVFRKNLKVSLEIDGSSNYFDFINLGFSCSIKGVMHTLNVLFFGHIKFCATDLKSMDDVYFRVYPVCGK